MKTWFITGASFLTRESLRFGGKLVADYDDRRAKVQASFDQRNGRQPGDPVKLAEAIVRLARETQPPMRFVARSIAIDAAGAKLAAMRTEFDLWRHLGVSTDYNT
jgi:hypothetical protein